jgi:hypothetical protein
MVKQVELTRGKVALVDDEDYEWLSQWKWRAYTTLKNKSFYAVRTVRVNDHRTTVRMHRVIMDAPDNLEVDHIDGDGLNNQRSNLRLATRSQNQANCPLSSRNSSGYKGVYRYRPNGRWTARLRKGDRLLHLGCFDDREEAARAYDVAALEYWGEFARLNFPEESVVDG